MKKKIFIITGEFSGDLHASKVVCELKNLMKDCIIEGVGESNLEEQGVKLFRNHEKMAKMGLTPSAIYDHIKLGIDIVNYLKYEFKPDLVLLVDYGAFNLQISKQLKKAGIKTFYFIPPQIWASRKWRINTLKKNIDKILTIFPFEKEFYSKEGIDTQYVGHPIVEEIIIRDNKKVFFKKHNLDPNKKLISIFPGSRMFEIKFLLKPFIKAAKLIEQSRDDIQIVFSHANSLAQDAFETPYKIIGNANQELLEYSDALILASGTVALEAAMYETPMLIAYKGPWLFYLIYLLIRNIKKACLVNIITGKSYVDEFLMNVNPKAIAKCINEMLDNKTKRDYIIEGCKKTKELLGKSDCAQNVAEIIYKELNRE